MRTFGSSLRREVVAFGQQLLLGLHHARLVAHIGGHRFFERLHRFGGVQRIPVEVEAGDLAALGLLRQHRRDRHGLWGGEALGPVLGPLGLFGPARRHRARRGLRLGHRIGWRGRDRIGARRAVGILSADVAHREQRTHGTGDA
ncbi:MAG: hypothetical protein QM742_12445 [Aquabacterium sp.]